MTETYNGYWSPTKGDCKEKVQDAYHSYPVGKKAGIVNEPYNGAYKVRTAETVTSNGESGK